MLEASALRQVRLQLRALDKERTGLVAQAELQEALAQADVNLGNESFAVVNQYFTIDAGVRYQEVLRNLQVSLVDGVRVWRMQRPTYTFESRNLRESDASTFVRRTEKVSTPLVKPRRSVIGQLQSDKVDYLTLGLARENFRRLDRDNTGLTPQMFESCFRARSISPASLTMLRESSIEDTGKIAFNKFNQIIEKYKYAPITPVRRRVDTEDHYFLSNSMPKPSSNKRLARNVDLLSEKLKAKFKTSSVAFRAFKHGENVSAQQFSMEMVNLGLDFSPEETHELFAHISQGHVDLPFELFTSAFEATSPRPTVPPLPRLALTPERFPPVRRRDILPSDRSPDFAYGLKTRIGDNIEKLLHNDFARTSPHRRLKRHAKRGVV